MNRPTRRALLPLIVFVALAALLFYGLRLDPHAIPSPLIGRPAPAFSLPSLHDPERILTQETLRGAPTLVNVWASWCPSCREEHAQLLRIAREEDVRLVGLNWKDTRDAALQTLARNGDPYALTLFDPDNQAGLDWGVYGAPETFLVDADGIVRYKRVGPIDARVWREQIAPLVARYRERP